jgi:hypothetical protein
MAARTEGFSFSPVGRRHSRGTAGGTDSHRASVAFTPNELMGTVGSGPNVAPPPSTQQQQQPPRTDSPVMVSVLSSGSLGGGASSSVSHPPRSIAWRCGSCGYHLLAMDHNGQPLSFDTDAFGRLIPMQCPRCALEHTNWEQSVPFDSHGDYVNIKSSFSNQIVRPSALGRSPSMVGGAAAGAGEVNTLPLLQKPTYSVAGSGGSTSGAASSAPSTAIPAILQAIGSVTYKDDEVVHLIQKKTTPAAAPLAYYCGRCSRRMQRVDQFGKLVPLELDPHGNVVPMTCPGCKQTHAEWVTKAFHAGGQ